MTLMDPLTRFSRSRHFWSWMSAKRHILKMKLLLHKRKLYLPYGMVLCLMTLTFLTHRAGLSASAELLVALSVFCNYWFIVINMHLLVKWVSFINIGIWYFVLFSGEQTECANAITAGDQYIFVGCANGLVRIFSAATLNFITTMPAPHYLGVDVAAELSPKYVHSGSWLPDP